MDSDDRGLTAEEDTTMEEMTLEDKTKKATRMIWAGQTGTGEVAATLYALQVLLEQAEATRQLLLKLTGDES